MLYVKSKSKDMVADANVLSTLISDTFRQISDLVVRTLGPGGAPILLERDQLTPLITKDGVTVIKHLGFPDAKQNIILDVCKEASLNTGRDAGDGTTTAIAIAKGIYEAMNDFIAKQPTYNSQRIVRELQQCYKYAILPYLRSIARDAKDEQDLFRVALISANGDDDVARAVVSAVMSAGDDGTVLIQEDQGGDMRVETIGGYVVTTGLRDIGAIGSAFINDRAGQQVSLENGLVVLFDGTLNDLVLPAAIQTACEEDADLFGKPILVFAHGFSDAVIERFLKTTKSGIPIIPVKTPRSTLTNSRSLFLFDFAAYTNAAIMDPANAASFIGDNFGHFESARMNTYETFVLATPDTERLDRRVAELKTNLNMAPNEHDRAHLRAMIGKLTGGLATIWVGGTTDAEIRERRDRVQDAVEAVRSAISEGVVAGGCAVHIKLSNAIDNHMSKKPSWEILSSALRKPLFYLLRNCGEEDLYGSTVDLMMKDGWFIFDAENHTTADAFEAGVIEPTKVHRIAISNALSVASLLATIGGVVVAPRDYNLESQLEISKSAFKDMMDIQEEM